MVVGERAEPLDVAGRARARTCCCRAFCVPRRRDGVEVIGAALLASAQGVGHRTIAARLDRPPGTVRGWVRAFARRSGPLQDCAVRWTISFGDGAALPRRWAGSPLVDGLAALACAARAWVLRLGPDGSSLWELIVALTGGALLHGRPRDPPGY